MPLLTVIILQYRPDFAALRRTLASLAMQTTRDFEVVVADDGSEQDYFAETKAYLEAHGIHPAAFVKAEKNGGTVKNLLGGLRRSTGRWVFAPSPGDYLYDVDTLRWLLETLQRDEPRVGFGGLAAYCERAGTPCQLPGDTPFDKAPYQPGRYDAARAKRNMLLYDDGICGAALFYERELLENTLTKMQDRVLLAEDFSARLFTVEKIPIAHYDRLITWYEMGTGVSTDKTAASEARMLRDWRAMLTLLRELYPNDRLVRLAWEYYHNDRRKSRLVRGLVGRLVVPQNCAFKKAQRSWQPPVNGDLAELKKIYAYAEEETHA